MQRALHGCTPMHTMGYADLAGAYECLTCVVLQLRISYVSSIPSSSSLSTEQPQSQQAAQTAPGGASSDGTGGRNSGSSGVASTQASGMSSTCMGRCMSLPLDFSIKPTLSVAALSFMERFAPLLDGSRVAGFTR